MTTCFYELLAAFRPFCAPKERAIEEHQFGWIQRPNNTFEEVNTFGLPLHSISFLFEVSCITIGV
jgi:hypothetical protein